MTTNLELLRGVAYRLRQEAGVHRQSVLRSTLPVFRDAAKARADMRMAEANAIDTLIKAAGI